MVIGSWSDPSLRDQRFVNLIPDKIQNPYTGKETYYLYKRPGWASNTTPAAGSIGTAAHIWIGSSNELVTAFGATNSTVYKDTTSLGAVTGLVERISETIIGTTPNLVMSTTGNKAYYYPSGGALTQITDVDFPSNNSLTITGNFVHMNGYTYIMATDGTIWNSDLNSLSAWSATSFLSANMYPDKGVGLARYKDLIMGFGKESIEFFRDVGNATGSPLQKVTEATIRIGCINSNSIVSLEDTIAWVSSSDTGSVSIYIMEGYQPKRISTNSIDLFLGERGNNVPYLTAGKISGKTFLFCTIGVRTFVYCMEDQIWHEWSSQTILWHQIAVSSSASSAIYAVSRASTSGKTYTISPTSPVFQDDSVTYESYLQTAMIDFGTDLKKFVNKIHVIATPTTVSTSMSISWSDDDYITFSSSRTVDLVNNYKYINNISPFRRRAFKLYTNDAYPFRLEALEFELKQGMH